jgi:hypothetical protein
MEVLEKHLLPAAWQIGDFIGDMPIKVFWLNYVKLFEKSFEFSRSAFKSPRSIFQCLFSFQ